MLPTTLEGSDRTGNRRETSCFVLGHVLPFSNRDSGRVSLQSADSMLRGGFLAVGSRRIRDAANGGIRARPGEPVLVSYLCASTYNSFLRARRFSNLTVRLSTRDTRRLTRCYGVLYDGIVRDTTLSTMPVYKSIVAFVALAYLLAATGGAAGAVLCIGADGQVAIENATGGGCASFAWETTERPATGSAMRPTVPLSGPCDPCIDIPLGTGHVDKQAVLEGTPPSADQHLVPDCQSDTVCSRATHTAGTTARICPFTNTTLTHLRTVCLLT